MTRLDGKELGTYNPGQQIEKYVCSVRHHSLYNWVSKQYNYSEFFERICIRKCQVALWCDSIIVTISAVTLLLIWNSELRRCEPR